VLVRWGGTAAAIAYIATRIDANEVGRAATRISVLAVAAAVALVALNVVCGAMRWRVLLAAYGAHARPSFTRACRLYFESFFFNTYLPGAVAGDVVRGVVTRDVFGERGATAGLAVVLVERALGLFGVFVLLGAGLVTARDVPDTGALAWWSAAGIAGSLALVLALPFARRLAPYLPDRLRNIAEKVPPLIVPARFVEAAVWSIATQVCVAIAGWLLLHAVEPRVSLAESLLIVPLAAATTFLPITVGGAGAREAVYITLGAALFEMPREDALAASLALWLAHLVVGAAGALLYVSGRSR
jgi:uncharacterized membrane protein YbhN (UPF0104 family)